MMKCRDSFTYMSVLSVLMNSVCLPCLLVGVCLYLHSCHDQGGWSYLLLCQCTCTWVGIHVLLVWILHYKGNSWLLVVLGICLSGLGHLKCGVAVLWRREYSGRHSGKPNPNDGFGRASGKTNRRGIRWNRRRCAFKATGHPELSQGLSLRYTVDTKKPRLAGPSLSA